MTVLHIESDQSRLTTSSRLPFRGAFMSGTWLPAHHSCHSALLLPHEHVKHAPSSGAWRLPFPLSEASPPELRGSPSFPSDLCSNVTSWKRLLLIAQSKATFHPIPLQLLIPFCCSSNHLLWSCVPMWSSLSLGWELVPWVRNFEHYVSPSTENSNWHLVGILYRYLLSKLNKSDFLNYIAVFLITGVLCPLVLEKILFIQYIFNVFNK